MAFATAERTSFSRSFAHVFLVKRRMLMASSTFLPRTRSATRRTFCGEAFKYLRVAVASMCSPIRQIDGRTGRRSLGRRRRRLCRLLDLLAAVTLEGACQGELAELVP